MIEDFMNGTVALTEEAPEIFPAPLSYKDATRQYHVSGLKLYI